MALDVLQTIDNIEVMEGFLSRKRPPEHLREKVDLSYHIDNQSIIIFEIRPKFGNPGGKIESPVAKATYVKTNKSWKVYWLRANGNWEAYGPKPVVKSLRQFVQLVEEDKHHCFWG